MNEWPSFSVAELQRDGVLLVQDGNHGEYRPRPAEFVTGGTPFIRAADLANGQVLFDKAGGISDVALARIRKGIGRPGDILFSHKGTVGKLARVPLTAGPFVCSPQTTFWRVLDESRLRRDYLYAFMGSTQFINQWWVRKGETDMADYVSLTAQRQLRVTVPPVDIQRRIAEPLTAIDDLIENNQRRVELLDEMARKTYREWFVNYRYPGHEMSRFCDSDLGTTPDGWLVTSVSQLSDVVIRGIAPKYAEDGPWTVLNQRCIRNGRVSLDHARTQERTVPTNKRVNFGDVLINSTGVGTLGRVALYVGHHGSLTVDSHVTIVRPADSAINPWFGMSLCARQSVFEALGTGSTGQTELSRADIGAVLLAKPPTELCHMFANAIWPLLKKIPLLLQRNVNLTAIRDMLLPKLVTGQIDPSKLALDRKLEEATV